MKKTTKKTKMIPARPATHDFMTQKVKQFRNGRWVWIPRIKRMSWKRLAEIYYDDRTTNDVKELIEREAKRCGYDPKTILSVSR